MPGLSISKEHIYREFTPGPMFTKYEADRLSQNITYITIKDSGFRVSLPLFSGVPWHFTMFHCNFNVKFPMFGNGYSIPHHRKYPLTLKLQWNMVICQGIPLNLKQLFKPFAFHLISPPPKKNIFLNDIIYSRFDDADICEDPDGQDHHPRGGGL